MNGHLRETRLFASLVGGALMASVLFGVGACAVLPFGFAPQADDETTEANSAPAESQFAAAPEQRMLPPYQADERQPEAPMPRDKPALLLTVEAGDSVSRIAQRYGVAERSIIALNGLTQPYWLLIGQQLVLPREALAVGTSTLEESSRPVEVAALAPQNHSTDTEVATPAQEDLAAETASGALIHDEREVPAPPTSPGPRAVGAEPAPNSLSALARQAVATDVPLPPTRNTFLWPTEGRVISRFGSKPGGRHNDGINIAVPVGTEVRAAQNGVVAYAGNELRGYGNLVLIRHGGGWMTAYAHNETLLVGKGDVVQRGQVISRSGKSGRVSRPQAHFEIRRDGEPQDPLRLLTRK